MNSLAVNHLTKIGQERYFELSESGFVDVRLKYFDMDSGQRAKSPSVISKLPFSKQILCGMEESVASKFGRRYQEKLKEEKKKASLERKGDFDKPTSINDEPQERANSHMRKVNNLDNLSDDTPLTLDFDNSKLTKIYLIYS